MRIYIIIITAAFVEHHGVGRYRGAEFNNKQLGAVMLAKLQIPTFRQIPMHQKTCLKTQQELSYRRENRTTLCIS